MSIKSNIILRKVFRMRSIFIILFLSLVFFSSAHSIDNWTKWSDWMSLQDTGISWRYYCDLEAYDGKYRAFFEFSRSDVISKRIGDRTYAHVRLKFEGYSNPVKASFYTDNKKEWHYMPIRLIKGSLHFTSRVVYSRYRKQPEEWSE